MKKKIIIFFFIIIILVVSITTLVYVNWRYVSIQDTPMDIKVTSVVAFNANRDALHFGGTTPGGSSRRMIQISHQYHFPVKVQFIFSGPMADLVTPSDNDFILKPGETRNVTIEAKIPKSIPTPSGGTEKVYNGTMRTIFTRA